MEDLNKIKDRVRETLKNNVKARNIDNYLTIVVNRSLGFNIWVEYEDLKRMPSFESITRARRYIQNVEKLYQSNKQIEKARKLRENDYKETFKDYDYSKEMESKIVENHIKEYGLKGGMD